MIILSIIIILYNLNNRWNSPLIKFPVDTGPSQASSSGRLNLHWNSPDFIHAEQKPQTPYPPPGWSGTSSPALRLIIGQVPWRGWYTACGGDLSDSLADSGCLPVGSQQVIIILTHAVTSEQIKDENPLH